MFGRDAFVCVYNNHIAIKAYGYKDCSMRNYYVDTYEGCIHFISTALGINVLESTLEKIKDFIDIYQILKWDMPFQMFY